MAWSTSSVTGAKPGGCTPATTGVPPTGHGERAAVRGFCPLSSMTPRFLPAIGWIPGMSRATVMPPSLRGHRHDVSHRESAVTPRGDALEADGGAPEVAPAKRPVAGAYLAPGTYEGSWCCNGARAHSRQDPSHMVCAQRSQSKHSRRNVPISRSQEALACGVRTGVLSTRSPR